jgi:hypothetical protein
LLYLRRSAQAFAPQILALLLGITTQSAGEPDFTKNNSEDDKLPVVS